LQEYLAPSEELLFDMVDSAEAEWPLTGPTQEQAFALTEAACTIVLDAYKGFWDLVNREPYVPMPDTAPVRWQTVSRDSAVVGLPASVTAGTARVFDASGRQVAAVRVTRGQRTIGLRPGGLASGSYFIVFPPGTGSAGSEAKPARVTLVR
jgi:hypothetical protein